MKRLCLSILWELALDFFFIVSSFAVGAAAFQLFYVSWPFFVVSIAGITFTTYMVKTISDIVWEII